MLITLPPKGQGSLAAAISDFRMNAFRGGDYAPSSDEGINNGIDGFAKLDILRLTPDMKKKWFKEWGWIYYPSSWPGWILTTLAVVFCVRIFIAIDRESHSVSDTLYRIFPFWTGAMIIWGWIAAKTSK